MTPLSVRTFGFSQWQKIGKVRLVVRDFDCIITIQPCVLPCGDTQWLCPLRHKRKVSLTWSLMSHFSSRHTLYCYKLFKQLLRNSTSAAFAKSSLWPWTWYAAIVTVISQVTGSICCCHEPWPRSGFDSLPSPHLFDMWVSLWWSSHVERKEEMKSLWRAQLPWNTDKPVKGMVKNALGQLT